MRNEWVPFKRYMEMCETLGFSSHGPPLRPADDLVKLEVYSGDGPSVRYRVERRVPRRDPHDWGGYEFNLEDVESWMAWAAAELVRTPNPTEGYGMAK